MPGTFSPPPRVTDPDMHHGTCVTHVPWCMPWLAFSFEVGGENVPSIPGTCTTRNFTYLVRGPLPQPMRICYQLDTWQEASVKSESKYNLSGSENGLSTWRPRQHGCHFPDDIFKCIFLNENAWISIKISQKLVPKSPINNILALVPQWLGTDQAIIWTNDGLGYRRICALLGLKS